MKVAKVIGNIWATRKEEKLAGLKLLLVQPLDVLTGKADHFPIVAADIIGAGVGETVLVVSGSTARRACGGDERMVDGAIVGIIDSLEIESGTKK